MTRGEFKTHPSLRDFFYSRVSRGIINNTSVFDHLLLVDSFKNYKAFSGYFSICGCFWVSIW